MLAVVEVVAGVAALGVALRGLEMREGGAGMMEVTVTVVTWEAVTVVMREVGDWAKVDQVAAGASAVVVDLVVMVVAGGLGANVVEVARKAQAEMAMVVVVMWTCPPATSGTHMQIRQSTCGRTSGQHCAL